MSAISNFLTFLRSAIYAIDVRDGIADAIEQCYNDVNNPTLKTEALEAALQTKIDEGEMAALTIGDHTITAAKLAQGVIDNTLATSGAAADAAETGRQIGLLRADLVNQVGVFEKIEGYYINLTTDPVDLANPLPSVSGLAYSIIECSAGDVFVINAEGGDTARAWGFLDSGNHALSTAEANVTVRNLKITAPENAVKLVINDKSSGISYKIGSNLVSKMCESVGDLADLETESKDNLVSAINDVAHRELSNAVKNAILDCFANVAWINDRGPDYYKALENALYEDLPIIKIVRDRATSGEIMIANDKRAVSELIPFANEVPITIRLRLNTDAFAYLCRFEATDGTLIQNLKAADDSASYFYNKNNGAGLFGWTPTDNDEYTFRKSDGSGLSTMASADSGKTMANRFRLLLGDASLSEDLSSDAALPQARISGLLEVQGHVYRVQEEDYPVIQITEGRGTSGESIVDNAKRALSDPIPYNNNAPIDIQVSLDGENYNYLIKFVDTDNNLIIDSNLRTAGGTRGALFRSYNNSPFLGFSNPRDTLVFADYTDNAHVPSTIGQSATGQTPNGYFRITLSNAESMDAELPDNPVSGIIDVQGVKYKLVTQSSN